VLKLKPPGPREPNPCRAPHGRAARVGVYPKGGAASPPAWLTARAAPFAALLGTSAPALTLHMASIPPIRFHVPIHVLLMSFPSPAWSFFGPQKPDLVPKMQAPPLLSEGGALKAAGCSAWKRRQSNPPPSDGQNQN
jgi:hypothetical protein